MKQSKLPRAQAQFVEDFAAFGMSFDLPPSVAKVLAFLLICHPATQTADAIRTTLNLSVGAVSTALNMLGRDLIQRSKVPGDRHMYYELDPSGWQRTLEKRMALLGYGVQLAETGLSFGAHNERLIAMRDMYAWFLREFAASVKRRERAV